MADLRAIIFQHDEGEGPGFVAPVLEAAGFRLRTRVCEVRMSDVDTDLVVVMGGPMGVYEADRHPFLVDERELLKERLRSDRPVLGICLGSQLLASAAGAKIFPGPQGLEVGVLPLRLLEAAHTDPVFGALPNELRVSQWHGDTFDPVPGAVPLAESDKYRQQAFRLGRSYGFQFHPELDAQTLVAWARGAPEELHRAGRTIADLEADATALASLEPTWRALLERTVRVMREGIVGPSGGAGSGHRGSA